MDVFLPQIIGYGRLDGLLQLHHHIRTVPGSSIRLNWARVQKIAPAGYAVLACIFDAALEHRCQLLNLFVKKRFKQVPVIRNLMRLNASQVLPPPSIHDHELTDSLFCGREDTLDIHFPARVAEKFGDQLPEEHAFACRLILNELMQNSLDHSTSERYYLYAGPWTPRAGRTEMHVGVLDMGVTVPAKLEQKYVRQSDEEYLDLAFEAGITTRRMRPGGLGLHHTFEYLKGFAGTLTLISRRAALTRYFKSKTVARQQLKYPLMGTWCMARLPLPQDGSSQ